MIPVNAQQEEPSLSYVRAAWICPQQLSHRRLGLEIQKYLPSSSLTHRPVPGLFIHLGAPARLPGSIMLSEADLPLPLTKGDHPCCCSTSLSFLWALYATFVAKKFFNLRYKLLRTTRDIRVLGDDQRKNRDREASESGIGETENTSESEETLKTSITASF